MRVRAVRSCHGNPTCGAVDDQAVASRERRRRARGRGQGTDHSRSNDKANSFQTSDHDIPLRFQSTLQLPENESRLFEERASLGSRPSPDQRRLGAELLVGTASLVDPARELEAAGLLEAAAKPAELVDRPVKRDLVAGDAACSVEL